MPKPLKIRRTNEIAGLFVILGFVLVITAMVLGPRTKRWFATSRTLTVKLPQEGALGLRTGADVQILGSVVGSVEDISVTPAGEMEAVVSIRGDFIHFVRTDSVAIIRKPLGLGDAEMEITRGKGAPIPATGARLESTADKAPSEAVQETLTAVREEAIPAIKEVRGAIAEYTKLAAEMRGERASLHEALDHINTIAKSVEGGKGLAGMLLNDPQPAADTRSALAKLNASLDEVKSLLSDAGPSAKRLPAIMADLEAAMKDTREIAGEMKKLAANLPELEKATQRMVEAVPGLVLQVQESARQIQRLTEALQRNWLIRGGMEPADTNRRISPDRVGTDR